MNKITVIILCAIMSLPVGVTAGVLGNSSIGGFYGQVDESDVDFYGVNLRLKAKRYIDFISSVSRSENSFGGVDFESTSVGAGIQYYGNSGDKFINPFLTLQGVWVEAEATAGPNSVSDDAFGFSGGAGIEMNFNRALSFILQGTYISVDNVDDGAAGGGLALWLGKLILLQVSGSYAFDAEVTTYSASLGFGI